MITRIAIAGAGAASPAGWGVSALRDAVAAGHALERTRIPPPRADHDDARAHEVLLVPRPMPNRTLAGHPRLRRASPISHFAAAAAIEAMDGNVPASPADGGPRIGIVYTLMNGCVGYSRRFFGEVLENPATASPILFPETVFNAPASHLAAYLGVTGPVYTLIGDAAQFLNGLDLAAMWIELALVDACLVVGAEESDWMTAEGLHLLGRGAPAAEGAGCLLLTKPGTPGSRPADLVRHCATTASARMAGAASSRRDLGVLPEHTVLIDDHSGNRRVDAATSATWADWAGERISPLKILGNGMGASCAWQCALATRQAAEIPPGTRVVVCTGGNQTTGALMVH